MEGQTPGRFPGIRPARVHRKICRIRIARTAQEAWPHPFELPACGVANGPSFQKTQSDCFDCGVLLIRAEANSMTVAMQLNPDSALVERMMSGDEQALSALYDRYSGMLYGMLMRILRDQHAAEEIVQDLFFQLWRGAAQFDANRGSLPAWLMVIGRNCAISRLRRRENRQPHEDSEDLSVQSVACSFNMEDEAARRVLMDRLKVAMQGLPDEQREALELAYFEGMTQTEIAARTGSPLGTVKTRIRTAMQVLKQLFDDGKTRQSGRS
jgi:RNA polymerase sigma-70 factor (ECF subfamily)